MPFPIRASISLAVVLALTADARAFVGQTIGPMDTSSPAFYDSSSESFIAVTTGQGFVGTDPNSYDPGGYGNSSVQVSVSGSVSLTSHNTTPITYDVSGTVQVRLYWWDGALGQVQYGKSHTVTVPAGKPHVLIGFTETVPSWDPAGGPIYVLLKNFATGDYVVQDSYDKWFVTWYAGNCAPGFVSDGTHCIAGVLFGGRDVFEHDAGPDLTAFNLADSGGTNPDSTKAADPCTTEDYRCDSATGDTALPLSRCGTINTRIPLEKALNCPSGQATCSCNVGDTDPLSKKATCRMLLGTDFSSSGGPPSLKPTWADAPLTVFKVTTQLGDIKTPSDLCDTPGTGSCVSYTNGTEACTINCPQPPPPPPPPNSCVVKGLDSNEPRNELQDPLASDGSLIRPVEGDGRYYVWFGFVPSTAALDPFLNNPQCGTGGCSDESGLMFQFHQDGCSGGSPPLAVSLGRGGSYGQLGLDKNTWYWTLGSIQYPGDPGTKLWPISSTNSTVMSSGVWYKFRLYVRWSSKCNSGGTCAVPPVNPDGRVGFWINGSQVVDPSTARQTMWDWAQCPDNPNLLTGAVGEYVRSGFYTDNRISFPATVYLSGYAITTSLAAAQAVESGLAQ